ncbi:MAG: tRNA (N(6)-L-threonylcarbamoyladenosine(37)-C(2))-methylthiotransferase MtaB [Ruminococcus sp.]|nr:tRNA (N(6)-L-threonylcarbamoyladenosine(37)-C(2))-methylthiotransferase MtaB [Ruminococcus sp.]
MYKVFFITFGCKVSQYETELLRSCFSEAGFAPADKSADADVIVVNSCTVTGSGDSKSVYAVRKLRKDVPEAVIVLTGCMPQAAPEAAEKVTEADIVTGTKERAKLPSLVLAALAEKRRIVDIPPLSRDDIFEEIAYVPTDSHTRAFVKIQDGCECYCTYCMIPYARGRFRSKPLDDLRREVAMLAAHGRREIVLTGINIAFYGHREGLRLADAVEVCCRTEGIERVRLGSIEPEMMLPDDLDRLAALPQFCPQFHLSLQSGCAATLKRMNRRYTPEEYASLVEQIRSRFPEAAFTTDIMVGFPRETEEEFAESMAFAERIGFSRIHVFQYSPRQGTPAAKMEQIPDAVKHERADRMKALGERLAREYMQGLVGRTVPVLFEREKSPDFHCGHAPDYTLIKISRKNSKKSLRNQIFYVTIEGVGDDCCLGRIASEDGN